MFLKPSSTATRRLTRCTSSKWRSTSRWTRAYSRNPGWRWPVHPASARNSAMSRLSVWVSVACVAMAVVADGVAAEPELSAAQIVEKNVAARGGLEAWRKIQTMVWIGHIERASANATSMPCVLEQKRPSMTRFEIKAQNQVAVRIYDGTQGWKLRPASNGIPEVLPY